MSETNGVDWTPVLIQVHQSNLVLIALATILVQREQWAAIQRLASGLLWDCVVDGVGLDLPIAQDPQ